MRRIFTILAAVFLSAIVFAQVPEKLSYQAVVRNSSNELVINTPIGMEINILQGSANGTVVYTETQTPTTNANGLVSIEIGGGTGFNAIDWTAGPYFLETKIDPTGGTNYTITGTSQLLSVPYALHAKTAETITEGIIETDPLFTAWDKSTGISITKGQISDLGNYIETESDPSVAANFDFTGAATGDLLQFNGTKWVKVTPNYLTSYTETDPSVAANFDFTGAATGDLLQFNGTKWVKVTPNYAAGTHTHPTATNVADGFMSSADKTKLDGLQNADGSETKLAAGTNVTITGEGTTANPYVINASSAGSGGTHYLGEEYLDGIIFYLYTGSDGQQHGLVVSKTETATQWQTTTSTTNANRSWDGVYNTNLITSSPAKTWVNGLGTDWYLPSIDELSILWHNRFHANKGLSDAGATLLSTTEHYWSSTERDGSNAFYFIFFGGSVNASSKTNNYLVRAIRAF